MTSSRHRMTTRTGYGAVGLARWPRACCRPRASPGALAENVRLKRENGGTTAPLNVVASGCEELNLSRPRVTALGDTCAHCLARHVHEAHAFAAKMTSSGNVRLAIAARR